MNDCQIYESQKLFVMDSFQFRFVVTIAIFHLFMPFASSLSRKQIKQAAISCKLFSVV